MSEYVNMPWGKKETVDGFNFLGLGNCTSLITDISFSEWGETVVIHFVYSLVERLPYRIVFSKCYEIKWLMNDSELASDTEVDVIDFQIQRDEGKEYAYFHADIFDLIVFYGSMKIEKDW
jgi:hypothetical protein